MRKILLLALLAVAACDSPLQSHEELELWNALEIRDYQFVYSVGCFCGFNGPNPALLTVTDGAVTKVEPAPNAVFLGTLPPPSSYPTIDSLFAIIERAEGDNPATLQVEYDPTYHFPKVIALDPVERTADDEVTYRVEKFVPLTGSNAAR